MSKTFKVDYDGYVIMISPSFELGVDYTIIDNFNNKVIVCNATYSDVFSNLKDLFNHIYILILKYEKERKKKKNDNNV